jgi:hypothetical protein
MRLSCPKSAENCPHATEEGSKATAHDRLRAWKAEWRLMVLLGCAEVSACLSGGPTPINQQCMPRDQ